MKREAKREIGKTEPGTRKEAMVAETSARTVGVEPAGGGLAGRLQRQVDKMCSRLHVAVRGGK